MQRDGGPGGGGPGGGAGGIGSGSFTGPAQALEIIGNHAYGFSGEILVNNNTVTMFSFTSGNYYFVGSFSYGVDQNASLGGSKLLGFTIKMNDTKILQLVTQTTATNAMIDFDNNFDIIIPPYTAIVVESETTNTTNVPTYGIFTGRIYRG